MSDDDAGLWARVKAGDESAFAALFDLHEARLFRHACRMLTSREDAKDAVTVAFFELWRKRESVRLVDGSPLPWLLNTVAHSARNLERSGRRYRALLARAPVDQPVPAPSGSDETGVMAALKRLPAREQSVIVLTVLEGYPERAAAETLGIPLGTVKSRLARAKARLRDELTTMEVSYPVNDMNHDRLSAREHSDMRDLLLAGTHRIKPVGAHRMQIIAASVALVLVAGVTGGAIATASMLGSAPVPPAVTPTPFVATEAPTPEPSTSPPTPAPNPRKDQYEAETAAWLEELPPGYSWPAWDDLPHAGGLHGLQPQDNAAGVYRCMLVSAAWFAYFEANDPAAAKEYALRADAFRIPDDEQWTPAVTAGGVIVDEQLATASGICQGISGPLP